MDKRDVSNPDYDIFSLKDFFGGSDPYRIVIIIYIALSFILNFTNLIFAIPIFIKKGIESGKKISLGITLGILIVNFLHTFAYLFEWVITSDVKVAHPKLNGVEENDTIGGLVTGNLNNFIYCTSQGFLLTSTSLSQGFLINILFHYANKNQEMNKIAVILSLILGVFFPLVFTIIYYFIGAFGINDKFCYIAKFKYNMEESYYYYYKHFKLLVILVYVVRIINFLYTLYLACNIIVYVRSEKGKKDLGDDQKSYLIKTIFIPATQIFTVGVGILYRVTTLVNSSLVAKISSIYIILNTIDGVLFPLAFAYNNTIFQHIKKIFTGDKPEEPDDKEIKPEVLLAEYDNSS